MSPFDWEGVCAKTQREDPNKASHCVPCMVPCTAAIACSAGLKAALARLEWSSPILVACATKSAYDVLAYSDWICITVSNDLAPSSFSPRATRLSTDLFI